MGNGSCAVIEAPDGRVTLVDCGAARQRDLFARTIEPFLRERGIGHVDSVIITHSDSDHTLALNDIAARYAPRVYTSLPLGQVADLNGAVQFEVLGPSASAPATDNDASTVIRVQYAGRSVLFTGDIEEPGIESLLHSGRPLGSDVLIAPHHGSFERNSAQLLAACRPAVVVCSSSPRLTGAQQRFEATLNGSVPLKRTGISGAITLTIAPEGNIDVSGFRD